MNWFVIDTSNYWSIIINNDTCAVPRCVSSLHYTQEYVGDIALKALAIALKRNIYQLNSPTAISGPRKWRVFAPCFDLFAVRSDVNGLILWDLCETIDFDEGASRISGAPHSDTQSHPQAPIVICHNGVVGRGAHYDSTDPLPRIWFSGLFTPPLRLPP